MNELNKNPYKKILPFVGIILLSVIGAALINYFQDKKEEAFLQTYEAFEENFNQISAGDTIDDVKRLMGMPVSVHNEDKWILRGPAAKWEYRMHRRVYTVSFYKDEQIEENPNWRVYSKTVDDPAYPKDQMVHGYMTIIKFGILFSGIYLGYMGIRKIYSLSKSK